jgi:cytochrome o ubiquinol oxidase subunit 1
MGAGANVNAFFGIMTMLIAVPTGVKVFNWLFTMYQGRVHFTTPMLWFLGFVTTFTIGGMAGVLMSVPPVDFQVHNSLFLVAHFHSVIIGGVLFGFFAAIAYWFPKVTGFLLNEKYGRWAFWCWFVGFLLAFLPLYVLGLMGATRRLNHYTEAAWHPFFLVASLGAAFITLGVVFQLIQFYVSFRDREKNRDLTGDPWNGRTLEWSIPSPPEEYNFAVLPEVDSRDAFWKMKQSNAKRAKPVYEAIVIPKPSAIPVILGAFAFLFCFAITWHILWATILGLVGVIGSMITRLADPHTDHVMSPAEVAACEAKHARPL